MKTINELKKEIKQAEKIDKKKGKVSYSYEWYRAREIELKAKEECLKMIEELKCYCEVCAFEGYNEGTKGHIKLVSVEEIKQKLEGEK